MTQSNQNIVSKAEFQKKVEVEAAHLIHFSNMSKENADKVALKIVSEQYKTQ